MFELKLIGASGRPLCRWCHSELSSKEEEFCCDQCSRSHHGATPAQRLKQHVYLRDKGVCHKCGMDCEELRCTILNIVSMYGNQYARSVLMTTGFKKLEATSLAQEPHQDFWLVDDRDGSPDSAETVCRACASRRRKKKGKQGDFDGDLFDDLQS
jgi:hypothetical protein